MNTERPFSFPIHQLLDDLPPERSEAEIAEEYKALISRLNAEYAKSRCGVARRLGETVSRVTISLTRDIASRFGRLLEWTDDLIPDFSNLVQAPCPLYATRAMVADEKGNDVIARGLRESAEKFSFERVGDDCLATVGLEVVEENLDMTVSFRDGVGEKQLPFCLTIRDMEDQKVILNKKEFRSGEAKVRGLERGEYGVLVEDGVRTCEFSVCVK